MRCRTSLVCTAVLHSYAARLPSTSPPSVCTHCRTSSVCTAVLHSYALLVCRQHRRPLFVHVAEPRWYAPLAYIHTCCLSAVVIADLVRTHCRTSLVCSAVYICTRCSSAVNLADLRSYALQNLVGMHRCPTFVRAAYLPSTSLTSVRMCCRTSLVCTAVYIRMCCSSAVNIAILRSHALQNPICMCPCPTFVRAGHLPSFSTLYYFAYTLLLWPHFH